MMIDITQEQHQFLVDLLAESVSLWTHEAAVLLRHPNGQRLGIERLEQIRQAEALFAYLTQH